MNWNLVVYVAIMLAIFGTGAASILKMGERPRSSNVAKEARESGAIGPWPPPEIQPVMFEDGFTITAAEISARGCEVLVDEDGRIIYVRESKPRAALIPVEEWCGFVHGARLS